MKLKDKNTLLLEELLVKMIVGGFLALGVFLLALNVAQAQTVEQVAAEVDQTQLDLATVNGKADDAKTKVVGVEARVSALEARPIVDPTIEARVAALEANPGGVSQADHDALAARVTSLESPTTGGVFALYDSSGARLGEWQSRINFGRALIDIGGHQVFAQFDRDAVSYLGLVEPLDLLFVDKFCLTTPVVTVDDLAGTSGPYVPLQERSTEFFGGKLHATVRGGSVFVVDTSMSYRQDSGAIYKIDNRGRCFTTGATFLNGTLVYRFVNHGPLPTFYPPFSMVQE